MNSIGPEEGKTVPKQVKIVYKTYIAMSTSGLEPSVKAKDSAEPLSSTGHCGNRTRDKNTHCTRKLKRSLKSFLVNSNCWRAVSFDPTWTITRLVEDGSECSRPGSLSRMTRIVAPGRQCVVELKKRMFLVMESLTISIVGRKRGRGDAECWISGLDGGGVDCGGNFILGDGVNGDGQTETGAGARRGAGVKCGMERRALVRVESSCMAE